MRRHRFANMDTSLCNFCETKTHKSARSPCRISSPRRQKVHLIGICSTQASVEADYNKHKTTTLSATSRYYVETS